MPSFGKQQRKKAANATRGENAGRPQNVCLTGLRERLDPRLLFLKGLGYAVPITALEMSLASRPAETSSQASVLKGHGFIRADKAKEMCGL